MINPLASVGQIGSVSHTARVSAPQSTAGTDFTKVMSDVASEAVNTMKTGEASAISGINGNQSVQQVVNSIMTAEQALQTAIAVRDKLVNAYTEISRMAI